MQTRGSALTGLIACAVCGASPANAISLSPRGLGQVLIYPYYTVNESQDTLVSVVNATDTGKAVAVRFSESHNGRPALEFMLYLSPRDAWSAVVSQGSDDGAPMLRTSDRSCTLPAIPDGGVAFTTAGFAASPDGGPVTPARVREGSIELIAAADLVPGSPTDAAVTHVQSGEPDGGVPSDCGAIRDDGADYAAPSNGLGGSVAIVNVGEGTFFGYRADALAGFIDIALVPALPVGQIGLQLAHSADSPSGGARAAVMRDDGRPLELDYARGIDAVSAVYMAESLSNEFLVAPTLGANTDWVVTFPTKRWYVDAALEPSAPLPPFTTRFEAPGSSDVELHAWFHDQEEGRSDTYPPEDGCGFLCPGDRPFTLSYQTNVLRILPDGIATSATGVLGSRIPTTLEPYYSMGAEAGWILLEFASPPPGGGSIHWLAGGTTPSGAQVVDLHGLPATGFMVYNIINANAAPNRLANYGGAFAHRTRIGCQIWDDAGTALETCD
jgi:hypothetical protein